MKALTQWKRMKYITSNIIGEHVASFLFFIINLLWSLWKPAEECLWNSLNFDFGIVQAQNAVEPEKSEFFRCITNFKSKFQLFVKLLEWLWESPRIFYENILLSKITEEFHKISRQEGFKKNCIKTFFWFSFYIYSFLLFDFSLMITWSFYDSINNIRKVYKDKDSTVEALRGKDRELQLLSQDLTLDRCDYVYLFYLDWFPGALLLIFPTAPQAWRLTSMKVRSQLCSDTAVLESPLWWTSCVASARPPTARPPYTALLWQRSLRAQRWSSWWESALSSTSSLMCWLWRSTLGFLLPSKASLLETLMLRYRDDLNDPQYLSWWFLLTPSFYFISVYYIFYWNFIWTSLLLMKTWRYIFMFFFLFEASLKCFRNYNKALNKII